MEYPEFIARFYDTIYEKLRTGEDYAYYMNKIRSSSGPVLEVGVGTGRFFINALAQGADIYGVDISKEMIKVLQKKIDAHEHHRLYVQDAVHMNIHRVFSMIIAPFRMFSHIIQVEDQLHFLNRVSNHLAPGGTFIMDVYVPDLKLIQEGLSDFLDFEGETKDGTKLRRFTSMRSDIIEQISTVRMDIHWGKDQFRHQNSWEFQMRYFFRYELEHLIERSPLKLKKIYGSFREEDLLPDSQEFLVICNKPK